MTQPTAQEQATIDAFLASLRDVSRAIAKIDRGNPTLESLDPSVQETILQARQNVRRWDEMAATNPKLVDALYAAGMRNPDGEIRRGLIAMADAVLNSSAEKFENSNTTDAAYPRKMTFAVFGELLQPLGHTRPRLSGVNALQMWICQQFGVPESAVSVSPAPLEPEICLEGLTGLLLAVRDARTLAPATPSTPSPAGKPVCQPLIFLVTITSSSEAQENRIRRTLGHRAALGQPNARHLWLQHGAEQFAFLPHDIDYVLSSMAYHMFFRAQIELRRMVEVADAAGYAPKQLGYRFRSMACLDGEPATVLTELYVRETKDVVSISKGPLMADQPYFALRMAALCEELGIGEIKGYKRALAAGAA